MLSPAAKPPPDKKDNAASPAGAEGAAPRCEAALAINNKRRAAPIYNSSFYV